MTLLNLVPNSTVETTCLKCADRRCGVSDLEVASRILAHAVTYLIDQQLAAFSLNSTEIREAVSILCTAEQSVMRNERRFMEQRDTASWLTGANRTRALHAEHRPN